MALPSMQVLDVCQTEYCQTAAASVLNYIDFNVDPCDDFYQYTCGNWLANTTIPDDKSAVGTLNQVNDDNVDVIFGLLRGTYQEMTAASKVDPSTDNFQLQSQRELDEKLFKKLQTYFESCMNVERIDALGATPIYPALASVLASLPDTENDKIPDSKHMTQMILASHDAGSNTLVAMGVSADDKDPNTYAIWVDQSNLGLPSEEYYSQQEAMTTYQQGLNDIMRYILAHPSPDEPLASLRVQQSQKANLRLLSEDEVTDMVGRIIEFEKELAKIVMKEEDHRDPLQTYNPMTLAELQERYPFVEWQTLLRHYVPEDRPVPERIINNAPSYFEKLNSLLASGKFTVATLRDYFAVRTAGNWIYTLDTHTRTLLHQIDSKIVSGTSQLKPRKDECIGNANDALGHLVARYFTITQFGGQKERDTVEEMVRLVHETWINRLTNIDWLDNETKQAAINKVNKIKHKVAYSTLSPDEQSPQSLDEYYANITLTEDSFFDNEMSVLRWSRNRMWNRVGQPVDKDEWHMMAQEVNAYYSLTNNEIAVLDGILQYPVYNPHWPAYMNFGSLGMVIGHELTHAFDNAGRNYNEYGELVQWWTNETAARFQEKSQCFVNQYQNFTVQGPSNETLHVNGNLTLGENLADNGGIDVAYQAFREAWDGGPLSGGKQIEHYRLPGIDLSPEALFYVSFGRLWCKAMRPQYAAKTIYTSEHAPDRVRVNGVLQNSPEFAKIFNCPAGSPMNPTNKCHIW